MGLFFCPCGSTMKFNIADPQNGTQKLINVEEDKQLRHVLDKRIAQEVNGAVIGDQFADYTFKITGGFDKQGILQPDRVRLLLTKDSGCYRPKKTGDRKRKSVRGCIVSREISVLHLVISKRGKEHIPDLTNRHLPRRLGPKRANNIRKLYGLDKKDDPRPYVVRREIAPKEGAEGAKKRVKAPKIQRLITPERLQNKRRIRSRIRKEREHSKAQAAAYATLLEQRKQEKRAALLSKKSRASSRVSQKKSEKKQ